ncbi:MAG TPA: hypothetical protein VGU43_06420 [Thermoplasmata archaeon]|nr:hypothetical protein [Thermoplasmata archaeon]
MTATHPYQQLSSNQIRHLLIGPYDYERKLEGRRVDERARRPSPLAGGRAPHSG